MKRLYVILGFLNDVNGGVIYTSNKAKYMESLGWDVSVIGNGNDNIVIDSLKKYKDNSVSFKWYFPSIFTKRQREKCINEVLEKAGYSDDYDEVVIESLFGACALWGELVAKKIGARHIVFNCTANTSEDTYLKLRQPFYWFKHKRRELGAISKNFYKEMFAGFHTVDEDECVKVRLYCTNSVQDVDSRIKIDKSRFDYVIGVTGRMAKASIKGTVEEIGIFANEYPNKKIALVLIGSEKNANMEEILSSVNTLKNITVYRTDTIFPIPLELVKQLDVNIGSSGSASVMDAVGVITIDTPEKSAIPNGIIGYQLKKRPFNENRIEGLTISGLLKSILIDNCCENMEYVKMSEYDSDIASKLCEHIDFLEKCEKTKEYFDTSKIVMDKNIVNTAHSFINKCFGIRAHNFVQRIYQKVK